LSGNQADYLIRCAQDRAVLDEYRLSETLVRAPVLGEIEFTLPSTHDRQQKHITQQLKAVRVTLRPPHRAHETLEPLEVSVILAQEINPPKGKKPITWVLCCQYARTSTRDA